MGGCVTPVADSLEDTREKEIRAAEKILKFNSYNSSDLIDDFFEGKRFNVLKISEIKHWLNDIAWYNPTDLMIDYGIDRFNGVIPITFSERADESFSIVQ